MYILTNDFILEVVIKKKNPLIVKRKTIKYLTDFKK